MTYAGSNTRTEPPAAVDGQAGAGTSGGWIADEALMLRAARRNVAAVASLTSRRPGVTLVDAYRVQAAGIGLLIADGARRVGHKVGLTSAAMQAQMGVGEPDSGVLLDRMLVADGGELQTARLLAPRVEAEIAFRLGEDLPGGEITAADARQAVARVLLALEVIDTRYGSWQIGLVDSVADNASCGHMVLGGEVELGVLDPATEQVVLEVDGEIAASGEGRAVLGDPFEALVWLSRRLDEVGGRLRAGDVVLAGAVHASLPLGPGTQVRATSMHLPVVHLNVR
ncbi:fumarylacetoacetate hydrolase family protein [Lentzea sp. NPDC042327]|uniref:2-keto-4-pentenoate hydratase n=1 Tax=Lentzea sp. NPDC042327 TaxID=3154801 RepID=UPI0033F94795